MDVSFWNKELYTFRALLSFLLYHGKCLIFSSFLPSFLLVFVWERPSWPRAQHSLLPLMVLHRVSLCLHLSKSRINISILLESFSIIPLFSLFIIFNINTLFKLMNFFKSVIWFVLYLMFYKWFEATVTLWTVDLCVHVMLYVRFCRL